MYKLKDKVMETLVKKLEIATVELKNAYIEKVEKWAYLEFERIAERTKRYANVYYRPISSRPNIIVVSQNEYYAEDKWVHRVGYKTVQNGIDTFVATQIKAAHDHFQNSLEKLAYRIQSKGLSESTLEISNSFIGVNFECMITDGNKSVRAWTIIAEGPIQKPHYRYLVK